MDDKKKKKSLIKKLTYKYRLVIYNDNTFEEVWFIRLSRLNLISVIGISSLLLIGLVIVLIAFTPIRELIPGYPSGEMRRAMLENAIKLDSLERKISLQEHYFYNLKAIISGEDPQDMPQQKPLNTHYEEMEFTKSVHDSILRQQIEKEEQFNLMLTEEDNSPIDFSKIHFFTPLNGFITNSFDSDNSHFGIDIGSEPNKFVCAALDGTVTMADWTLGTGWVLQIQHDNNIISAYKHNAELLKKVGNFVKAGEVIAIVGNSGELTTGPHLHFELWHNGKPLNPEDYIIF